MPATTHITTTTPVATARAVSAAPRAMLPKSAADANPGRITADRIKINIFLFTLPGNCLYMAYANFRQMPFLFYVSMLITIAIIEKAKMPTITPATPQITADLACLIFSGSPLAVKNKIPAITNDITATPPNIRPAAISIPCIIGLILVTHGPLDGQDDNCAKPTESGTKIPDKTKNNVFLTIEYLTYLIMLPTTAIIEKARIPTTTPAIPQINADLAAWTFSAFPAAVKNNIPATIKAITAIPPNTNPAAFSSA
jgi:hypothetical protein